MKSGKLGVISAFLASACCALPALSLILGVSSIAITTFVGRYHWYFQLGAIALLIWAWTDFLKKKRIFCASENKKKFQGATQVILIIASIIVLGFTGLSLYSTLS